MSNPLLTKKFIEGVVLELGAIVTSYSLDQLVVLPLHFIREVNDTLLSLTLVLEEENPSVY